jgi:LmbE family N-acetylglucosaminyl deacetylase
MLFLSPQFSPGARPQILFLGAHSDDIEIGCGATVLNLARQMPKASVHWVVFSAAGERGGEAKASADAFLSGFADARVELHEFRDAYFPQSFAELKDAFEALKAQAAPDLIFTHHGQDRHQDHRVVAELTWNTFRDHLILEYEIPKYDGGLGDPNVFVPADAQTCARKFDNLLRFFQTQKNKHWFTDDLFSGLMRLRGLEGRSPSGMAEAFHCRKLSFGFGGAGAAGEMTP